MVDGRYQVDNMDSMMNHELLLPGMIVGELILAKLKDYLFTVQLATYKAVKTVDLEKLFSNGINNIYFW